jgi:hypothetical protein
MDAGIPNRSYPCGVRALLQVQRETHLVVQRERALLLVQRETHLVVKRETVASISPSPPQNSSLKKPRRPAATLLLSTPLHTADPLVPSTRYTKTMQQQQVVLFIIRVKRELKTVYRNGCRCNERLNAETGGSKTPRIHWVARVNIE